MGKRDYVNLQEIEKQAKSSDYKGTINVNAISEQEIVKPYLDKLKNSIKSHVVEFELFGMCDEYVSIGILEYIINNLLSEQGDTE